MGGLRLLLSCIGDPIVDHCSVWLPCAIELSDIKGALRDIEVYVLGGILSCALNLVDFFLFFFGLGFGRRSPSRMDNSGRDCILGFIMVLGKAIGIGVDPVDGGLRALLVLVGRT